MVTTLPRALAAILAAAVLLLGVPMSPANAAPRLDVPPSGSLSPGLVTTAWAAPVTSGDRRPKDTRADDDAHHGKGAAHSAAHPRREPVAVPQALPAWSGGDHRPFVRDLPDGYTPAYLLLPDVGGPWARAPLPESTRDAEPSDTFALPLGRAPPHPLTSTA